MDVISVTVYLGSKIIFILKNRYIHSSYLFGIRDSGFDFQFLKISRRQKTMMTLKHIQKEKFQPNQSYLPKITPKTTLKIREKVKNGIKI